MPVSGHYNGLYTLANRTNGRDVMGIAMKLAAVAAAALSVVHMTTPASAACQRMGFLVNDYGKDGPTKDAKELLDKHIAKTLAAKGITKYQTGAKSVSCELFLNFIVFDEHTCTASATVCWDGSPLPKGETASAEPAAEKSTADKSAGEKPAGDKKAAKTSAKSDVVKTSAAKSAAKDEAKPDTGGEPAKTAEAPKAETVKATEQPASSAEAAKSAAQ